MSSFAVSMIVCFEVQPVALHRRIEDAHERSIGFAQRAQLRCASAAAASVSGSLASSSASA